MLDVLLVLVGLVLLVGGGELLVGGATRFALHTGLSPAVIGLTVVAIGTSLPELAVSIDAARIGAPDLAVGNVVGSNFYNIALILGVAAMVRPCVVRGETVRLEIPVMVVAAVAVLALGADGSLDRLDGVLLLSSLVLFLGWTVRQATSVTPTEQTELDSEVLPLERRGWLVASGAMLLGVAVLVGGARALVSGSVALATDLGISERVIGLSMVAVGTSLPELATSVVAAFRGHDDIAVGNVVGSNIFNVLGILGLSGLITTLPVSPVMVASDIPWMIGVSIALAVLLLPDRRVQRWKALLLLGSAAAFTAKLYLDGG